MILILSEKADAATDFVIDWLMMDGIKVLRIDDDTTINHIFLNADRFELETDKNQIIKSENIEKVWIRRRHLYHSGLFNKHKKHIQRYLQSEWNTIKKEIYRILALKGGIINIAEPSKLTVLEEAKKLGLNISDFFITDRLDDVPKANDQFIVKAIKDVYFSQTRKNTCQTYTESFDFENNNNLDSFFPTLFQNKIDNLFDLKVIFLKGKSWAVGIYTDNKSVVDFRKKYNLVRYFSWKLPEKIEESIHLLMNNFALDFGVLDFVVTPDYEYYFLEINPWGQFMGLSIKCNYNIDYEIYKILSNKK